MNVEKQMGPSPEYPPQPNERREFVVQAHFRGASGHLDFRFALEDHAEGWTVSALRPGATVPVVTVAQAEALLKDQAAWKLDLKTGRIFPRKVKTTVGGEPREIIRPGSLLATRKAGVVPLEWLDVEGRTEWPPDWPKTVRDFWKTWPESVRRDLAREGYTPQWAKAVLDGRERWEKKEIPVGATRAFPGIFYTFDRGTYTLGARKPWFFEYFIEAASRFRGRIVFRMVRRVEKTGPASPEELLDAGVHVFEKEALILPPGEAEAEAPEPFFWVLMTPEEEPPMPYVLSQEAIDAEWLPPQGAAALPEALRERVPKALRFWLYPPARALTARKELSEWYAKEAEGHVRKANSAGHFRYLAQTWRGQIIMRTGPTNVVFWLDLSFGKGRGLLLALDNDLRIRERVAGVAEEDPGKLKGLRKIKDAVEPAPGTGLNPTKDTPSRIELIEEGPCEVVHERPGFYKLKLSGQALSGLYLVAEEEPGAGIFLVTGEVAPRPVTQEGERASLAEFPGTWLLRTGAACLALDEDPRVRMVFAAPTKAVPEEKAVSEAFGEASRLSDDFLAIQFGPVWVGAFEFAPGEWLVGPLHSWELRPIRKERKQQIVYGVVLSPYGPDGQEDIVSAEEIERAAHRYLMYGRQIGVAHKGVPILAFPVESFIARTDHELEPGNPETRVRRGEWVLGVWIADPEAWALVERGEFTGWSIQGWGRRRPMDGETREGPVGNLLTSSSPR